MSAAIPTNGVTRDIDVENERTPLLRRQDGQVETLPEIVDDLKKSGKTTPLPKIQLTLICLIRLTEPVAFTVIFPYVSYHFPYAHVMAISRSRMNLNLHEFKIGSVESGRSRWPLRLIKCSWMSERPIQRRALGMQRE